MNKRTDQDGNGGASQVQEAAGSHPKTDLCAAVKLAMCVRSDLYGVPVGQYVAQPAVSLGAEAIGRKIFLPNDCNVR